MQEPINEIQLIILSFKLKHFLDQNLIKMPIKVANRPAYYAVHRTSWAMNHCKRDRWSSVKVH